MNRMENDPSKNFLVLLIDLYYVSATIIYNYLYGNLYYVVFMISPRKPVYIAL